MLTLDRHLLVDIFLSTAQEFLSNALDDSLPVWRMENIGRIRDYVAYFAPDWEEGVWSHIPRRNYRGVADGEEKARGQTSLCSMAERVAALREVTPSLL